MSSCKCLPIFKKIQRKNCLIVDPHHENLTIIQENPAEKAMIFHMKIAVIPKDILEPLIDKVLVVIEISVQVWT